MLPPLSRAAYCLHCLSRHEPRRGRSRVGSIASIYHLAGFSLREFIQLDNGITLPTLELHDIMEHTSEVVGDIFSSVNPGLWMDRYLEYGYYPFHLEPRLYSENLLKTLNMNARG